MQQQQRRSQIGPEAVREESVRQQQQRRAQMGQIEARAEIIESLNVNYTKKFFQGTLDVSQLQSVFRDSWRPCMLCNSPILNNEEKLCCDEGRQILAESCWPHYDAEFLHIIESHRPVLQTQAGFINNHCAFAKLSVESSQWNSDRQEARAGWVFPFRTPSAANLHLGGRTYSTWNMMSL